MVDDTTKKRMATAKRLIQQKEYDKALSVLERVDHPTARKWEAKIKEITKPQKKPWHKRIWVRALIVIILVLSAYLAYALNQANQIFSTIAVEIRLADYCRELYREVGSTQNLVSIVDICHDWAEAMPERTSTWNTIMACHELNEDLDAVFSDCLLAEEILPTGIVRR